MAQLLLHPATAVEMLSCDYMEMLDSAVESIRHNALSQMCPILDLVGGSHTFPMELTIPLYEGEENKNIHLIKTVKTEGTDIIVGIEPKRGETPIEVNISKLDKDTDYDNIFKMDIRLTIGIFNIVRNLYVEYIQNL